MRQNVTPTNQDVHGSRSFARIKAQEIADSIKRFGIKEADLLIGELSGAWNFITVPISSFENRPASGAIAIGTNGVVFPDLETARIDELRTPATLSMICDPGDAAASPETPDDPRRIAKRAEAFLRESGIADRAEFSTAPAFYALTQPGRDLADTTLALRSQAALALRGWGVESESHRAGACAGQAEIALGAASLVKAADDLIALKYAAKSVAAKLGQRASFMPKLFLDRPGSGMACRITLSKNGRALFYDGSGYANCSQTMLRFAGGLLAHASSLLAFTAPTTNSYKRFAAEEGARTIAFSARGDDATVDIGGHAAGDPKAKQLEFRAADGAANPYLAYAAMLLAGLDGIRQKIDPVRAGFGPLEIDLGTLPPHERQKLKTIPATLRDSLAALATDHAYLTADGVFTAAFVRDWIAYKTARDLVPLERRPTPHETELSFDC